MANLSETNSAVAGKEAGSVERSLNNVFHSTELLDGAISELHHQLNPVLSDDSPKENVGEDIPNSACKLSTDLDLIAARNFSVVSRIRRILDQLEL